VDKLQEIARLADEIAARARAIPMDEDGQLKAGVLGFIIMDLQVVLQDLETLTEDDYRD
jgi:hypothetical protein